MLLAVTRALSAGRSEPRSPGRSRGLGPLPEGATQHLAADIPPRPIRISASTWGRPSLAIANTAGGNSDPNGHGTHVSGTIAALTGNGVGVSAIAPDTTILPIKVLGANGSGYMSDTAEGIIWAADHSAGVINMSLGTMVKVTAVSNAITYARSKGVVVVASAVNSRSSGSPTSYPAADEGVIAVAATDSADAIAGYSNAGSYVDVAAPGSNIISTYPRSTSVTQIRVAVFLANRYSRPITRLL